MTENGITYEDPKDLVEAGWPDVLMDALCDCYRFALRLRGGPLVYFETAERCSSPQWVKLVGESDSDNDSQMIPGVNTARGLEVRVADIQWIVKAWDGS